MSAAARALGRSASLYPLADPRWRAVYASGARWLLVPVVGWPIVLGFRRALVRCLFSSGAALPRFEGALAAHLVAGLGAMAVIFGHLAPLYGVLFGVVAARGWVPGPSALVGLAAFAVAPVFSPLSLPLAILAFAWSGWLAPHEAVALLAAFATLVFVVPAGFLEVSRTGRFASAFRVDRSLARILRDPRGYLDAWIFGVAGQTAALLAHVRWPCALFHAYLVTVVRFNALLVAHGDAPGEGRLGALLARDVVSEIDEPAAPVTTAALGPFHWPARTRRAPRARSPRAPVG